MSEHGGFDFTDGAMLGMGYALYQNQQRYSDPNYYAHSHGGAPHSHVGSDLPHVHVHPGRSLDYVYSMDWDAYRAGEETVLHRVRGLPTIIFMFLVFLPFAFLIGGLLTLPLPDPQVVNPDLVSLIVAPFGAAWATYKFCWRTDTTVNYVDGRSSYIELEARSA